MHDVPIHPTELAAVQALVAEAAPGDVVGVMCHAERVAIEAWLAAEGATVDGPDEIRAKVLAARGRHEPEDRIPVLMRSLRRFQHERIRVTAELGAERPGDRAAGPSSARRHLDAVGKEAERHQRSTSRHAARRPVPAPSLHPPPTRASSSPRACGCHGPGLTSAGALLTETGRRAPRRRPVADEGALADGVGLTV